MAVDIDAGTLRAPDPQVVLAAQTEILTSHRGAVKAAVETLEQARDGRETEVAEMPLNDRRLIAIRILSELRAPEGVNELSRIVHLKVVGGITMEHRPTLGDYYPAAGALVKIGMPAVDDSVWELTKDITAQRRKNLCWVIGEIEGPKVARWRIEELIAELQKQQIAEAKAREKRLGITLSDPGRLEPQAEQIRRLRAAVPILEELFAEDK